MDWKKLSLATSIEPIIKKSGQIVLSYFRRITQFEEKETGGFVTEADLSSEQYLTEELGKLLPGASFIGEEMGNNEGCLDYCWVIDPLDGTTNFVQGIPYFCVSIALTWKDEPLFGAIYQPITDEYFYAQQGNGAYLNGKQICVSRVNSLDQSVPVIGFPYKKDEQFDNLLRLTQRITPKTYAFRHFGAAALDQAYVACGRLDAVFFEDLGWWDVAAGMLLIAEAGGKVTDYEGNQVDSHYKTFLAAGPDLYTQLRDLIVDPAKS